MPQLDNPRQERFAIFVAKGTAHHVAYRKAGYKSDSKLHLSQNAARLLRNTDVALRVKELQQKAAEHLGIDVDLLVAELDDAKNLAMQQKHPAAAVGAIMGKAKLLGLIVERAEIDGTLRRPMREPGEVKRMSLEEWQQKFAPKLLDPKPQEPGEGETPDETETEDGEK